jgi:predicted membrane protein
MPLDKAISFVKKTNKMKNKNSSIFWAIILTSAGILFLMRNFGLLHFNWSVNLFSWRLIPLIIGINAFLKGKKLEGLIGIGIAVVFFIPDFLTDPQIVMYRKLWPLLLVAGGGLILSKMYFPELSNPQILETSADGKDFEVINENCIMGGSSNKIVSKNFKGGRVNIVMGGLEYDFRDAQLTENVVINTFVLMGGLELIVPKEWNVKIDVLPIMGGVEDQINKYPSDVVDPDKKLILTGNVVMGGINIRRV